MPAWSMQMRYGSHPPCYAQRMSMSAFVSVVPTALLTRALWCSPAVPVCLSFVGLAPYRLPHLGNSKGVLFFKAKGGVSSGS